MIGCCLMKPSIGFPGNLCWTLTPQAKPAL